MARSRIASLAARAAFLILITVSLAADAPSGEKDASRGTTGHPRQIIDRDQRHLRAAYEAVLNQTDRGTATEPSSADHENSHAVTGVVSPAMAPGLKLAATLWDFQSYGAVPHAIATNGSGDYIHFAWTHWDYIPDWCTECPDRFVHVNTFNSATGRFIWGIDGALISGAGGDPILARGFGPTLDVDDSDRMHVAFHQRSAAQQPSKGDFSSWVVRRSSPEYGVFLEDSLRDSEGTPGPADDVVWPHVTVDQRPGQSDYIHVVAHTYSANDNLYYWRNDETIWQGPVLIDSTVPLSYNVAADRTSEKAALVTTDERITGVNPFGLRQVTYRESFDNGSSWLDGTGLGDAHEVFITGYNDPNGAETWFDCVGDYDNSGNLHIVWSERRYASSLSSAQAAWKNWNNSSGATSTIHLAYYDNAGVNGGQRLNVCYPSLGFGDGTTTCGAGTNLEYIYMTFAQYGGPTAAERNDSSGHGFMNSDIYLSVSNNGGLLWSPAKNLTNSGKPGCDPATADSCPAETWPSIARTVDDTIHIMYIYDRSAGDAPFGEGSWTFNPVMYYRIPGGTNVQPLCPMIAPNFAAELSRSGVANCEYHAPPNTSIFEQLFLRNLGNATMTGAVTTVPPASWLVIAGAGPYALPTSSPGLTYSVIMNAAGLAEGLYQSSISITHNDPTKASPFELPVDFFVFSNFACPEQVALNTRWLRLQVSNVSRIAGMDPSGSLNRPSFLGSPDSGNASIYDASLIITRPPNMSTPPPGDTIVYRYIYGRGKGQPGFRALSSFAVDTSAYGTSTGRATARARMTTIDSMMGIDVEYLFPQSSDSSNFVLINYRIDNRTTSTFPNLMVGEAVDFNVMPSAQYAIYQNDAENKAGRNTSYNLIYQRGADSGSTPYAAKFLGGMTAIQCTTVPRSWSAPSNPWLTDRPGSGFSEGYLYSQMTKSGFEIIPPNPSPSKGWVDMHSVMVFEKNVTLTPSTVRHYTLGLVSSTLGPDSTDLVNTVKKAWRYAFGWHEIVTQDTVLPSTPASYRYQALGSHEAGLGSGCCGCVVSKVSGSALLTITPDADPCTGTISFDGTATIGIYSATFRVQTPVCTGQSQYTEDQTVTIAVESPCYCPRQGDVTGDGVIDVFDVIAVIDRAFNGGTAVQDPVCPVERADVNGDGVVDVFDAIYIIEYTFAGGPEPVNPCA